MLKAFVIQNQVKKVQKWDKKRINIFLKAGMSPV